MEIRDVIVLFVWSLSMVLLGYSLCSLNMVDGCFLSDDTGAPVITIYPRGQSYADALETFNHEWAHYTDYKHFIESKARLYE